MSDNFQMCLELTEELEKHKKRINKYKQQLKAKEQECEELKDKLINLLGKEGLRQSEKEFYEQQLDQLKAENEELKRQHQGDKGLITATGKMNYELLQEYDKLKTALTEIKEIAKKGFESSQLTKLILDLILQKISECEGNNEYS